MHAGSWRAALGLLMRASARVQANLSYQELVRQVRETLHKAKFTQNPCLECEKPQVSAPFIC